MKKVISLIVGLFLVTTSFSQDFEKGSNVVTLGFGVDPYYSVGAGSRTALGPVVLTYERGITDVLGIGRIGVGGGIAQSWYHREWSNAFYSYKETRSRTGIMFRAAYHFEFGVDKMDVYAGVGGAAYIYSDKVTSSDPDYNPSSSSVGGGHYVFGGIRYYKSHQNKSSDCF